MNLHKKLISIPKQPRAYVEGTVEFIGEQWIFFDDIEEEAFDLEGLQDEFEVFRDNKWSQGKVIDNNILSIDNKLSYLLNGEKVRYKKKLSYSFQELIAELDDTSFLNFVKTLNDLSYSLYDCIFCNYHLGFLQQREEKSGMNVIIFDNEEQICSVQHYFYRKNDDYSDRFEFAQSNGKRVISSSLNKI